VFSTDVTLLMLELDHSPSTYYAQISEGYNPQIGMSKREPLGHMFCLRADNSLLHEARDLTNSVVGKAYLILNSKIKTCLFEVLVVCPGLI